MWTHGRTGDRQVSRHRHSLQQACSASCSEKRLTAHLSAQGPLYLDLPKETHRPHRCQQLEIARDITTSSAICSWGVAGRDDQGADRTSGNAVGVDGREPALHLSTPLSSAPSRNCATSLHDPFLPSRQFQEKLFFKAACLKFTD